MIDSERDVLIDQVPVAETPPRYGGPLAMLCLVLMVWVTGRFALWEDPFPGTGLISGAAQLLAEADPQTGAPGSALAVLEGSQPSAQPGAPGDGSILARDRFAGLGDKGPGPSFADDRSRLAEGHYSLWRAALTSDFRGASWRSRRERFEAQGERQAKVPVLPGTPPFTANTQPKTDRSALNRWTLDAWAFLREGSGAAPIAQGRVPVYGASQIGANLQFRIAPLSGTDPRLYLRAYRALIDEPESEIAAGVSARPMPNIPVRVAAELRATDNRFSSDLRPAAYAITELPPLALPLGLSAEIYAGAGYVGGEADTGFFDGQATVTRSVASFDLAKADDVRLSLGAGAWGGAQRDANRVDVGPTMRIDLSLGTVPARVSINYRERVGGDASPVSGLAATLSTQF